MVDLSVIKEAGKTFMQSVYAVGYFSEVIILILTISVLYTDIYATIFYIIGIIFSLFINQSLKRLIKEPRPSGPIKFLNSDKFDNKAMIYGMPSGHSQHLFFSAVYLYLSIGDFYPWYLSLYSAIGLMTMIERYYFRNHTILQLIVGAIMGGIIGFIVGTVRDKVKPLIVKKISDKKSKVVNNINTEH